MHHWGQGKARGQPALMAGTVRGCRPSRQVVRGGYREGRRLRVAETRPEAWPALPGLRRKLRKYGGAKCWEAAEATAVRAVVRARSLAGITLPPVHQASQPAQPAPCDQP